MPRQLSALLGLCLLGCLHSLPPNPAPNAPAPCSAGRSRLSGVIVDAAGAPVRQQYFSVHDPNLPWWHDFYFTEDDGSFQSRCYPPRVHEIATQTKTGFVPWTPIEPGKPRRIILASGGKIDGTVADAEGHPLKGYAYLRPADEQTEKRWSGWVGTDHMGEADASGKFQYRQVPPGNYELIADVFAGESTLQTRSAVKVAANEITTAALRAEAGLRVSGRVIDDRGRGVAGARIVATSDTVMRLIALYQCGSVGGPRSAAITNESGEFVLTGLTHEPWHLYARRDGAADSPGLAVSPPAAGITIALAPATVLAGTVVGPDGKPLPAFGINGKAFTPLEGKFSIQFPEGRSGEVVFEAPGHVRKTLSGEWPPGQGISLEVMLPVARQLCGRVTDSDLEPITGAHVTWTGADRTYSTSVGTDTNGAYCLDHDGSGAVRVLHFSHGAITVAQASMMLDVVLPKPGILVGSVRDEHGQPVQNAYVVVRGLAETEPGEEVTRGAYTDAGGAYKQDDLPPGSYEVSLQTLDFGLPAKTVVVESGKEVRQDFRLPDLGARLVVDVASGKNRIMAVAYLRSGLHQAPTNWSELERFTHASLAAEMDESARTWEFRSSPGVFTLLVVASAPGEQFHYRPRTQLVHVQAVDLKGEVRAAVNFPDSAPGVTRPKE
jgi:hypothetical protein